jgi:hypothetical protein
MPVKRRRRRGSVSFCLLLLRCRIVVFNAFRFQETEPVFIECYRKKVVTVLHACGVLVVLPQGVMTNNKYSAAGLL